MLLEELLGKVLEVTLGELLVGSDGDLGIITTDNGHLIGETTGATLDLDAIVKELLLLEGFRPIDSCSRKRVELVVASLLVPLFESTKRKKKNSSLRKQRHQRSCHRRDRSSQW